MNYRNSVGARLMLAFAGVIIVFGAAVALSIGRLAAFNTSVTEITGPDFAKVELAGGWMDAISESMRHTRNMLIMDDKAQIQGEIAKVRDGVYIGPIFHLRSSVGRNAQGPMDRPHFFFSFELSYPSRP